MPKRLAARFERALHGDSLEQLHASQAKGPGKVPDLRLSE